MFRHEARDVLRNAVNASEHDSVIFAGTGCTGAVHKLIDALGIRCCINDFSRTNYMVAQAGVGCAPCNSSV